MEIHIRNDDGRPMGSYRLAGTDPDDDNWRLFRLIVADNGERIDCDEIMLPRRGASHDSLVAAVGFAVDDATAA